MPDELVPFRAEDLVQRQLNAYNARDLDAFVATYAEDVEVYYQGQLAYTGRDALRDRYRELFENAPRLHATVLRRDVDGDTVVDHERTCLGNPRQRTGRTPDRASPSSGPPAPGMHERYP
jgi:uncharacterized protein (TIGR02246 family)